jgi:hypothetical protein
MTTRIYSDEPSASRMLIRSAVVTSTSLHASILHDSERLRAEYPSIERFKMAAQQNITRWYSATVKLLPMQKEDLSEARLLEYSTQRSAFVPSTSDSSATAIKGPFTYFLSTSNVDRLEPEFCITPLQSKYPSNSPCLDVVLVRPGRDASLEGSKDSHKAFASKMGEMFKGAYSAGAHVDLLHDGRGGLRQAKAGSEGTGIVEYYRCGGWEWTPVSAELGHVHFTTDDRRILGSNQSRRTTRMRGWHDSRA